MELKQIADAFLSIESMSPKKLQKLCYYAYSWDIVVNDVEGNDRIIDSKVKFEAWVHGPVNRNLYSIYKDYGYNKIPKIEDMPNHVESNPNAKELVMQVFRLYGHMSGDALELLTHDEQPWIEAREGLNDYESSNKELSEKTILNFYKKKLEA